MSATTRNVLIRRGPFSLLKVTYPPLVKPDDIARIDDFTNVCRVCAKQVKQVIPIKKKIESEKFDWAFKINKYLPIKVKEDEVMPRGICEQCATTLLSWDELWRSSRLADLMLRRRLATTVPPHEPRPSVTVGTESTKNGVKYVDAGTDAPELPPRRRCAVCPLMLPAKRFSYHITEKHSRGVFRCEECNSFQDVTDLLFHFNRHSYELLSPELKEEYHRNENSRREEQARRDAIDDAQCQELLERFRQEKEERERQRRLQLEQGVKSEPESDDSEDEALAEENPPSCNHDKVKSEVVTEPESDVERASPKRKRITPKRCADAETSPPKRQSRGRTASLSAARGGRRAKEADDRDDGNDGDDEVNTPEASPSTGPAEHKEGSDNSPKSSRTCPICGKQYRASSSYFYHMKYFHKRSREHECSVCNKKFGTKANLAQHASIHGGAYDLECKECGKRFKSKPSLYIHEQSHGGPKRWACAQCGRSFRWRTHLARHVTRHAAERAHVCVTCGRGFSVRCDLLRHARTHAADEFHCATCGLKFAQKRYLQVHMVKKHSEAPSQVVTRS